MHPPSSYRSLPDEGAVVSFRKPQASTVAPAMVGPQVRLVHQERAVHGQIPRFVAKGQMMGSVTGYARAPAWNWPTVFQAEVGF